MMSKNLLCRFGLAGCVVLTLVWAMLALSGSSLANPPDEDGNHSHGGGGGGGGGAEVGTRILVCIKFDDLDDDGVQSDDRTAYCDGDSDGKVTAEVGGNRHITLDGNNSKKKTAGRTLFLDLTVPLGCAGSVKVDVNRACNNCPFGDGTCDDCFDDLGPDLPATRFGDLPSGQRFGFPDNAGLVILGMDLDDLPVSATFDTNARLTFSVGGEAWVLHWGPFKNPGGGTFCPESNPVRVTRVDLDTWRIETTGDQLACLYRTAKHADPEYRGQFVVPFGATVVAIEPELGEPDGSTRLMVDDVPVEACPTP